MSEFKREQNRIHRTGVQWLLLGGIIGGATFPLHQARRPLAAARVLTYVIGSVQTVFAVGSTMLLMSGAGAMAAANAMTPDNRVVLTLGPGTIVVEPPVIDTKYLTRDMSWEYVEKRAEVEVSWTVRWPPLWVHKHD